MPAPTLVLSETNTSAATVTDSTPTIAYASADLASTSSSAASNPVAAGGNSFEKYNRWKVTAAAPNSISAMSIFFGAGPTDGNGLSTTVAVKFAANATFATPVATTSTVATTATSTDTTAPGVTLTAPANTVGSYSAYFATQFQTTSAAIDNITFQSPFVTAQYSWS